MRLRYIIVREKDEENPGHDTAQEEQKHSGNTNSVHEEAPTAQGVIGKALYAMNGYSDYVMKHGSHFTDALAEWASQRMENAHGDAGHHWKVAEVKAAFSNAGLKKPERNTWGDAAYAANMHYADYYGDTLKSETDCIRQAYSDLSDPDGYPGKVFNRWCSDLIGQKAEVPWERFI